MPKQISHLPPLPPCAELRDMPLSPRLVMEISRLLRARMQREECGVMAQSTARVVMAHLAVNESLGQLDIVNLTHLKPPTVSTLLYRMEAEGYITRVSDARDKRANRVALSEKGRAFDREQLHRLSTNDHQAVKGLSQDEQKTLEALLLRVRDNLTEV
ncbi:MAG: MarR family transcriptional regulator [Clostridia bacterium]|nr:MarR family transcriptional regulator [Clostridia bacterium]